MRPSTAPISIQGEKATPLVQLPQRLPGANCLILSLTSYSDWSVSSD